MDPNGRVLAQRIADEFPSAAQLMREDLQELADTPSDAISSEKQAEFLDALVYEDAEVRALYDEHQQLLKSVEDAAAHNIQLRPELEYARQQTREAFEDARATEATWQVVERELNEAYKVRSNF
ncbi:hypothetical protein MPSI1_001648 [Malassezia psittaci]|uniref:VPS37 C-terminal domain-containing protein n=1 Tax=Malassezia psittaci TaxID=1821823 RepID=A0AAF0FE32_9BASI|nr:hypothetical protein MPSI1_001648 [Malassezia psittaci]